LKQNNYASYGKKCFVKSELAPFVTEYLNKQTRIMSGSMVQTLLKNAYSLQKECTRTGKSHFDYGGAAYVLNSVMARSQHLQREKENLNISRALIEYI